MKRSILCLGLLLGVLCLPLTALASEPPLTGAMQEPDAELVRAHLDLTEQYDSGLLSVEEFAGRYMDLVPAEEDSGIPDPMADAPTAAAKILAGPLEVLTVPWIAAAPTIPHAAYNGRATTFKAIARGGSPPYTYKWDFNGDGVYDRTESTTVGRNLSTRYTYPDQTSDRTFIARIHVTDSFGETGTAEYPVEVKAAATVQVKADVAIDDGLWRLHTTQIRQTVRSVSEGYWSNLDVNQGTYGGHYAAPTASAVQAFLANGHLETGHFDRNPYVETVQLGLKLVFRSLEKYTFSGTDPGIARGGAADTNGNGFGIGVGTGFRGGGTHDHAAYESGQVMDAIAATGTPDAEADIGANDLGGVINGRTYQDILTDMVDTYAWYQRPEGGWRYMFNDSRYSDNSAAQWGAIGIRPGADQRPYSPGCGGYALENLCTMAIGTLILPAGTIQ